MMALIRRIIRRFQPISIILFAMIIAFLIGFVVFSEKVTNLEIPVINEPVDGIIVLTGGKARLDVAIELLKDKKGKRLLISGVHPDTSRAVLMKVTNADKQLLECCIDLDRSALNTVGNAAESERWIRNNDYKRVIIVTNNYHMPRSILELSRLMSDVEFIPYPVINTDLRSRNWISQGDALRVLFTEYVKYLGSLSHVTTVLSQLLPSATQPSSK